MLGCCSFINQSHYTAPSSVPGPPETTITTQLLPLSPGFMATTFEWEEPDNTVPGYVPSEYFILLGPDPLSLVPFRAKNTTSITISPMNATQCYSVYVSDCTVTLFHLCLFNLLFAPSQIVVYLPCALGNQMCSYQGVHFSCGEPTKLPKICYKPPLPSSSTTSTGQ